MIERGEIYAMALDPVVGSEIAKTRPCLVVQRDSANATSTTTLICPLTSARNRKPNAFKVLVRAPEAGVDRDSLILCNQVRVVSRERLRSGPLGKISPKTMAQVDEGLRLILDLGDE